jgi:hypothetical protein
MAEDPNPDVPDVPDDALPDDDEELGAVPLAHDDGDDICAQPTPMRPEAGTVPSPPSEA